MGKSRVFIAFLMLFSLLTVPSVVIYVTPLKCADKKNYKIRESDTAKGCKKTEYSLGSDAISRPLVRPTAINQQLMYRFKAAQAAAKKDGQALFIASGFRTVSRQKTLFEQARIKYGNSLKASKWVAPPLISRHPWGVALDVNYPNEPVGAGWLEVHGYKFGLCRVFENEWWHFEPVIAPGEKCPVLLPDATYSLN